MGRDLKVTWSSLSWERSLEKVKYPIQSHIEASSDADFIASLGRCFPLNDCFYCKKIHFCGDFLHLCPSLFLQR